MQVTFVEDADLELFEQLQGWRIEVRMEGETPFRRFRILGIEEEDDGPFNILYGFPADVDWECPGYDRFLSTRETDEVVGFPIDLVDEMTIWP